MAVLIVANKSGRGVTGFEGAERYVDFFIAGTDDDEEMHAIAQANLPLAVPIVYRGVTLILTLKNYSHEYKGGFLYELTGKYSQLEPKGQQDETTGETLPEYAFDTTGGTAKFTHGKTISKKTYSGGRIIENHGGINVTDDNVEGVDWPVPQFSWSETHYFDESKVTPDFIILCRNMTGKVNLVEFRGNQKGEIRCMGVRGTKRGRDKWQLNFMFDGSPNATNLRVAQGSTREIIVDEKEGFHYLWTRVEKCVDADGHALTLGPATAYVSQVLPDEQFYADLNALGLPPPGVYR